MKKICVTGAYGFIGKSICETLVLNDKTVIGLVRNLELSKNFNKVTYVPVGDIGLKTNLKDALVGTDCVIHCAAIAHKVNKNQTFKEQQIQKRRPRFSIFKEIIQKNGLKPVKTGDLSRVK